ncbi:transposase [Collinsella tanakaei]|uniref:transposase n=1 Tax=Collinsella tanakaei TaxID=626935 RepID=UPI00195AAB66|nr:transposase [Collinsella tanakaei]
MSDYVTAIGLDVHARSIKAFALNPMTGECERASFGYDPAAVAEWALGFQSPRAVYESGVTGFHLCRALNALGLDCVVGAVSKMQRPAADRGRKTDRRDCV